jgi:hypothetical protein
MSVIRSGVSETASIATLFAGAVTLTDVTHAIIEG